MPSTPNRRPQAFLKKGSPQEKTLQRALAAFRSSDLMAAERAYTSILSALPDQPQAIHGLALVKARQGLPEIAETFFRRALSLSPANATVYFDFGIFCASTGNWAEAIANYEKAASRNFPGAVLYLQMAHAYRQRGDAESAILYSRRAIKFTPGNAAAHYELGLGLSMQNLCAEAIACYEKALAIDPKNPAILNSLGIANEAVGKTAVAVERYRQALQISPGHPEAHNNLGAVLFGQGRQAEAISHYQRALLERPIFPLAENNLGIAEQADRHFEKAANHYKKAIAEDPKFAAAYNNLGALLNLLKRFSEAEGLLRKALELKSDFPEAHNNLGTALHDLTRDDEAVVHFKQAIALRPNYAEAFNNWGILLADIGKIEEALQVFSRAVTLDPNEPAYYRNLFNFHRVQASDPRFHALVKLADSDAKFDDNHRIDLHFTIGKAFEDIGDPVKSFAHYKLGNQLKRKQITYDEERALSLFEEIQTNFTAEFLSKRAPPFDPGAPRPIFVIGMPRSGTSLVEQILCSIPGVSGAGESPHFPQAVEEILKFIGGFPMSAGKLTEGDFQKIARQYLDWMKPFSSNASHFTDKLPGNFLYVGMIHRALPGAKIVHIRRNPLDTCVSCFSKLFTQGIEFGYDLGELGRYYAAYEKLMQHWRTHLPTGAMFEIDYEDLVDNFEKTVRTLLAYCSLEWTDACLKFYETQRPVRTASAIQVRQPIYRQSLGRWRKIETELTPLIEALSAGRATLDRKQ